MPTRLPSVNLLPSPDPRDWWRACRRGATYTITAAAAVVIASMLLWAPLQTLLEQRDLVEQRTIALEAVQQANHDLERRATQLRSSEHLELLAREEQGMYLPGWVPYVLVPPDGAGEQIVPAVEVEPDRRATWLRVWEALLDAALSR